MKTGFTRITLAALCLSASIPLVSAQDAKPAPAATDPADIHVIKGNPPADSPFGKLKLDMRADEALAILGKPTSERSYCTGKHRIPFYFGRDKAYAEYFYKGQGKVYFYADFSTFSAFHGAVNSCTPKSPSTIAGVEFNPNESGEVPKEGGEAKKETAEAAK